MAFAPTAFVAPQLDKAKLKNNWLKAYEPGTVNPKMMAIDSAGSGQAARFQINSEGFTITAGNAIVIPHVDGAYDMWLFPTAAEADADDTSNALQLADNITGVLGSDVTQALTGNVTAEDTLADVLANTPVEGKKYYAAERTTGNGGGAHWVAKTGQTPNGYNIVQFDAPNTSFSAVLVETQGEIFLPSWGAEQSAIGTTTGFDNSPVLQAAMDYATVNGNGIINLGQGRFYMASNVNSQVVNDGFGTNGVIIQGAGQNVTELFTDQTIDMFTHQDQFHVKDLSIAQRGADGVTKFTGVAFRANGQTRYCSFENVSVWRFKFGVLQRFSLWMTYRNCQFNGNLCGIKLARNDNMEDQTNPSPVGGWNQANGWFHNMITLDRVVFNGDKESAGGRGEIGIWAACQGITMINCTAQNYERSGAIANQTIPIGQVSTCVEIVGGGPTSSNSFNNVMVNFYIERSFRGLVLTDIRKMSVISWFVQGQAGGETMLAMDNSECQISGQTGQTPGFTNSIDLQNNSLLFSDGPLAASGAALLVDGTSDYNFYGIRTPNGDIGDTTKPFRELHISGDAFFGTSTTDPAGTGDDGVAIDNIGRVIASRNGPVAELNSRAVDGDVIVFRRSNAKVGSVSVVTAGGQQMTLFWTSPTTFNTSRNGSPEGALVSDPGSTCTDTGGGAGTTFYVKETGTGNTGWVAK